MKRDEIMEILKDAIVCTHFVGVTPLRAENDRLKKQNESTIELWENDSEALRSKIDRLEKELIAQKSLVNFAYSKLDRVREYCEKADKIYQELGAQYALIPSYKILDILK